MTHYWVGVASADHVATGVAGGFCQLGHGKAAPVERLTPGDKLVYYSPRTTLKWGEPVQALTAIGTIASGDAYRATQGKDFHPVRRDVTWHKDAKRTPIKPLLDRLSFTRDRGADWGIVMRRSAFAIDAADYRIIATPMGLD